MQKNLFIFFIVIISILSVFFLKQRNSSTNVCTMEAKLCEDGSSVGRQGPDCKFAECPPVSITPKSYTGTLTGRITLYPVCPVESVTPNPLCEPKPFSTLVDIFQKNKFILQVHTDQNGVYLMNLPVGDYTITPHIDALYPRCPSRQVSLVVNTTTNAKDISCDSGIR